jgi:hypothetical protein
LVIGGQARLDHSVSGIESKDNRQYGKDHSSYVVGQRAARNYRFRPTQLPHPNSLSWHSIRRLQSIDFLLRVKEGNLLQCHYWFSPIPNIYNTLGKLPSLKWQLPIPEQMGF